MYDPLELTRDLACYFVDTYSENYFIEWCYQDTLQANALRKKRNMELNKESQYLIENTNGVLSFVGPKGGNPVPLRDDEIKRIFGEIERKDGREIIEVSFLKGDAVKIISGPFVDFNGVVEEINEDKQKVKVIVSIFGRPTPVELDFFQVEMYK